MKKCKECGTVLPDDAKFCSVCGTVCGSSSPKRSSEPARETGRVMRQVDPYRIPDWDHTMEYGMDDVKDNKITAMLAYILGPLGIIIAAIYKGDSPFVKFHIKQGIKIQVLFGLAFVIGSLLLMIMSGIAFASLPSMMEAAVGALEGYNEFSSSLGVIKIIMIILVVWAIYNMILMVVQLISFFSTVKGEAKEPPIIRALTFLK